MVQPLTPIAKTFTQSLILLGRATFAFFRVNFGIKQRGFRSNCQAHCTDPTSGLLEIKTKETRQERPEREAAGDTTIWGVDRTDNGTTKYSGALLEKKHEVAVSLR